MGLMDTEPLVAVPDKLLNTKIKNGKGLDKFRADFLRSVAPQAINRTFQSMMLLVQRGNPQAVKLAAEMFGLVASAKGGVNVNVNQNANTAVITQTDGEKQERVNFDSIIRSRAESKKAIAPPPPTYMVTSEEVFS